jgi:hypothetical protein
MKRALRTWFQAAREGKFEAITTTHALAETWATLTAIPVEPRIAPAAVERVIERLVRHIKPIALRWDDYKSAMQRCGERVAYGRAQCTMLCITSTLRAKMPTSFLLSTQDISSRWPPTMGRALSPHRIRRVFSTSN